MYEKIPGYLLIINNKTFKRNGYISNIRYGTEEDARRLKEVFGDEGLGFRVEEMNDLTAAVCTISIKLLTMAHRTHNFYQYRIH